MNDFKRGPLHRTALVGVAAAAAIVLGAGVPTLAAQPAAPNPGAVWTALAAKLGVPPSTLLADVRQVKLQEFQQFAAARHLRPDQIRAGEEAIQSGQFAIVLMRHHWGRHLLPVVLTTAAATLHLTPEALQQELQAGKTLTEIASAQKVAPATLQQAIATALQQNIDAAVGKGDLTRAEAAKLKAHLPTLVTRIMNWRLKVRESMAP